MVISDETAIHKGIGFVQNVVVGGWIKHIAHLVCIFLFYLLFDEEGHVAESKAKELVQNQPIVVNSVESMAVLQANLPESLVWS